MSEEHTQEDCQWRMIGEGLKPVENCELEETLGFSTTITRVDYGDQMFRITITAQLLETDMPGLPKIVGRLVAYRQFDEDFAETLAAGAVSEHFFDFDNISRDAGAAMNDLVETQDDLLESFDLELEALDPTNLVFVSSVQVQPEFRGFGIGINLMVELKDMLAGLRALVFLQALPIGEELTAAKREAASKALAKHWMSSEDLGLFQPTPEAEPQFLVGLWGGEMINTEEPKARYIQLEKINPR